MEFKKLDTLRLLLCILYYCTNTLQTSNSVSKSVGFLFINFESFVIQKIFRTYFPLFYSRDIYHCSNLNISFINKKCIALNMTQNN